MQGESVCCVSLQGLWEISFDEQRMTLLIPILPLALAMWFILELWLEWFMNLNDFWSSGGAKASHEKAGQSRCDSAGWTISPAAGKIPPALHSPSRHAMRREILRGILERLNGHHP